MNDTQNIPDPKLLFASDNEKTFSSDESLPSLPVPDLQHTLQRYLDSVKPHVTDEEYRQTEFIVQQFASGIGKELHKKLVEKASKERNWLEKWWEEKGYLELGIPMVPFMNLIGPGPYVNHFWTPQRGTQLERAGFVLHYVTTFWKLIRSEKLKVEVDNKGRKMCMNQMRRAFSTCRVPGVFRDQLLSHFKTESEGQTPVHAVVLYKGRMFSVDMVDDQEEPLRPPEIQHQLTQIKEQCDKEPPGIGLGALTGETRKKWAEMRSRLSALHPENFHNLKKIETSLFTVSLDETEPQNNSETFFYTGAGINAKDRWFDKSVNHIFYRNGICGCNCDHAPYDGMVMISSTFYIDLNVQRSKGKWQGSMEIRNLPKPTELKFHVDSVILEAIVAAEKFFLSNASLLSCNTFKYTKYGKKALRKHKLHPDTHIQLVLQYAYYKTHGKPAPVYETATTRKFYHGRTETLRSCTVEAVEFCKAMCNPKTSVQERKMTYLKAANRHNKLMEEAKELQGCDRHLLGLATIAEELGLPKPLLYQDKSFTKSGGGGNFELSTSFVGYTPVFGGVAAMTNDGYGSFYHMEDKYIEVVVTTWKTSKIASSDKFAEEIQTCFDQVGSVVLSDSNLTAKL
ncbi:peroxisomal carnitine O-octanoyltransferase-like [Crassostrea angulata]|uniref:peroxisomal carnitine O-octanoyltransferase-like n=1 Tax=Magallana angulata TaxID=2784310 RepID=UPI0022B19FBB|nr:peroxisomal carnitine O-octanoyltransferase-like [Crassostrea angulata]